jgi:hypothetical protein
MDAKYSPRTGAYGLQPRKPRSYEHLHLMTQAVKEPFLKQCWLNTVWKMDYRYLVKQEPMLL